MQSRVKNLNVLLLGHFIPVLVLSWIKLKLQFDAFLNQGFHLLLLFDDMVLCSDERALVAIDRFHAIDENHKKVIHVSLVLNDKINHPMAQLESDALPRVEWDVHHLVLLRGDSVHVLSQHPKPGGSSTKHDADDVIDLAA